jgi:lysophospholipase L1-like esterase
MNGIRRYSNEIVLVAVSSLFGVIITLLAAEVYFWIKSRHEWVAPLTQFDAELGWANVPAASTVYNRITYTINSQGLRSPEINPGQTHIVVAGDSVAYGSPVNDDETLSHYLGQLRPEHQVLNLGVAGYSLDQYYLALRRHLPKTRPAAVVVVIFPTNDWVETGQNHMYGVSKPYFEIQGEQLVQERQSLSLLSCGNVISRSRILEMLSMRDIKYKLCNLKFTPKSELAQLNASLLTKIKILSDEYRVPLLFVLSPSMEAVKYYACVLQGNPEERCNHMLDSGFALLYSFFEKTLRSLNDPYLDLIDEILSRVHVADLDKIYAKGGKDPHHFSPLGNRLVAEAIHQRLTPSLHAGAD